jgi:hypothetical protein
MATPRITSNTPEVLTDTVYLHLRPTTYTWNNSLTGVRVVKLAKSVDAQVEPGDYIVKLDVSVPREFFDQAMPSARITLEPGHVVAVSFDQVEEAIEVTD